MRYLCLGLLFLMIGSSSCSDAPEIPEHPNIVWITSEDNSKHYLSLFDANGVETPHIAALAKEGILFKHAFSNAPVCSVARSALISGCYGPRIGTQFHRKEKIVPMPEGLEMFPSYLRKAGYYTSNNSKEDYNIIKPSGVWDDSSKKASWRNREKDQPFFHVQNIGTTHEGGLHFTQAMMDTVHPKTNLSSFTVQPNHPNTPLFQYTNAHYRDRIQRMDEQLGEVVAQLKADKLLENTFVFYFGDHGGVLPGSKGYIYETGLHVPLVVHVPEQYKHLVAMERGEAVEGFVSFVDFGPTVLELAGIEAPKAMDGVPFLGKDITPQTLAKRDIAYGHADRFDEKYDMVRSIRKGRYKYILNFQPFNFDGLMNNYRYRQLAYKEWHALYKEGALNDIQSQFFETRPTEQLFDVETDPYETKNLAKDEGHQDIVLQLRDQLFSHAKEMNDLSFFPESYLVEHAFENPTKFGYEHKSQIASYIDVAQLALMDFEEAKQPLESALKSNDPWSRYWGLIVCSSFNSEANAFTDLAKQMAQHDPTLLNRVRAAEFLGIIQHQDPAPEMTDALYKTIHGTEALEILNSIVLMQDAGTGYRFDIDPLLMAPTVRENKQVKRRLDYLKSP